MCMLLKLIKSNLRWSNRIFKFRIITVITVDFFFHFLVKQVGNVSKDSCGGSTYKAGKEDSVGRKGLSETGLVFSTCRHGYLLRAVDMDKGETYRHVHYLHNCAFESKCKFICYDVVCKYWPFASDVSSQVKEFECLTPNMKPFLSRWHGKTHAWYCQVKIILNRALPYSELFIYIKSFFAFL